jgi:uncharacterized protein YgiM (DUF1202 family)
MGNIQAECGLKPNNLQNSYEKKLGMTDDEYTAAVDNGSYTNFVYDKAGYGIVQWTYWSLKRDFLAYVQSKGASIGDLEIQLEFLCKQLSENYAPTVWNVCKSATSVLEASNAMLLKFERPADQSEAVQQKRASYGEAFYAKYAGKTGGVTSVPNDGGNKMSNSSLVNCTVLSPNHSGKRTHAIDRITPHCVVGQLSAEGIGGCFTKTSRQASCNYGIGFDGRVCLIVDEDKRSWCTSSSANDQRAVTIEVASDKTEPYAFKEAAYNKLVDLCVDICRRNGKNTLLWIDNKDKALAYQPKANEMLLTVHRWFANKSCPGNWMYARMGQLASTVTARLGGSSATPVVPEAPKPTTPAPTNKNFPATPFMVQVLVDDLNIRTKPEMGNNIVGVTKKGSFTIVEVKNGWGLLKSYASKKDGWIYLENGSYVKILNTVASNPTPAPAPKVEFKNGDVIKLVSGATYWNGKTIPSWVFNSTLYYRGKNENGIIFSTQKTGAVTGVVKESAVVGATASSNTPAPTPSKPASGVPYMVRVTADALNYRKGPGTNYAINGTIRDKGSYTIVEVQGNWGRLKSGAGWICLDYTKKV